ncbi:MAG: hypothetical protein ACRDIX_11055 [Actinomycetota bacterium]
MTVVLSAEDPDLPAAAIGGMREDEAMGLKLIAIIALLWLGIAIAKRLGHGAGGGNAFPRWVLSTLVLSVGLVVAGSLLIRFALRSGNAALMLVAAVLTLTFAVAVGWYVARAARAERKRHQRPRER